MSIDSYLSSAPSPEMSLILPEVDWMIAKELFPERKHWKGCLPLLKKIYYTFGRSTYSEFIQTCKEVCFKRLFKQFNVNQIDDLLQKVIHTTAPLTRFPTYQRFHKSPVGTYSELNSKHRCLLYYLAAYYGYFCLVEQTQWLISDRHWTPDDEITSKLRNGQAVPYWQLKKRLIHNPERYELVKADCNPNFHLVRLKPDHHLFKLIDVPKWRDLYCVRA